MYIHVHVPEERHVGDEGQITLVATVFVRI